MIIKAGRLPAQDYGVTLQGGKYYYLYVGFDIINYFDVVIEQGNLHSHRVDLDNDELDVISIEDKDIDTLVGESVNEIDSFNDAIYDDVFIINSLYLETNDPGLYKTTVKTDKDGIARAQIPYGKYTITEKSVSDKYWLNSVPKKIEFSPETGNEFSIENEKKAVLTVHHCLEDTTEKVVEDQVIEDEIIGESYLTMPTTYLDNLKVMSRESNEHEENKIDYNEESKIYAGTYTHDDIEVTYYYGIEKTPLTVHHYIEGTQTPVPLADGTPAPDTTMKGLSGTNYETSPISVENLHPGYELAQAPINANGTYGEEAIELTYYYAPKDFNYTVEYYYGGEKDENKTATGTAKYGSQVTEYTDKNIIGYKFEKVENLPLTITETAENNKIKVYYIKDNFNYTVEYYYSGEKDESKTEISSAEYGSQITEYIDKNKTGYKLSETVGLPLTITETAGNNVIKVYYVKDNFDYTVEYYYSGVKDESKTETSSAEYGSQITEYTDKNITGYKLSETVGLPLTITETAENNKIKVYYIKDNFNYTVEYYYSGEKDESKTETKTAEFGSQITTYTDKNITGYKLEKTERLPLTITENADNNVISVYYVKDSFGYKVEYYYDGEKDDNKTETKTAEYQSVVDAYEDKNIAGYKFDKVENLPLTISENVENNVIEVYYVKDSFAYTVEYYYDGEKDESKTATGTAEFGSQVTTYTDKNIPGYKLDKVESLPLTISETAENNVIKVYYKKDGFGYTVEYYYDGEKDENKTETKTAEFGSQITTYTDKNITGYKLEKTEKLPLTITENADNNVISVYYVKDSFGYKVEYYYNGEKDESKTETKSAKYQDIINECEDKIITGYKFDKTENLPLTITENVENNVIKVYYVKDNFGYKVEYYYDGEKDDNKTETKTAEYQSVVDAYEDKNITGYKLEKTEDLPLTITENADNNVISVYYVKDSFGYKVEYYYNGEKDESKTETKSAKYQDIINECEDKIITGYKFDKTENLPLTITENVENNVIKVYYVKDNFEYKVEYYYDGEKDENKTEIKTAEYQSVIDTYEDKNITGYKLEKTEGIPLTISETAENNVIKVYYVLDDENTKVLSYKVEYYKDGEKADTETERKVVQILEGNTLEVNINNINTTDKYSGYIFEKTEPAEIPDTVETGAVIKVYYVRKDAKVIVHHYYKNSTEKIVEDEEIEGKVFDEYTTSPSEGVPVNYKCVNETPDKYTGEMTEEPIEVSYYYEVKRPLVEDTVTKTATANETKEYEITNGEIVEYAVLSEEGGEVTYEIKYSVKIKDYIGKADVEIIDELPAGIVEEKSDLKDGLYDEIKHTITWQETIEDIDTYANGEYEKEITKTIKVVYSGQDLITDLVNKADAKIRLYYPEEDPVPEDEPLLEEETEDEVIVKQNYTISIEVEKQWNGDEGNERKRPESIVINVKSDSGDFDKDYVISAENNWSIKIENLKKYNDEGNLEQYIITEKEVNEGDLKDYDYKETTKETVENDSKITYKYIVKNEYNPVLELDAKMTKTGSSEMEKSNQTMKYEINFKSKAKGDALLTIVDKLPYKIDKEKSDIADGIYDEDALTITWKEEIKREDDEEYSIDISKKITLVYKDVDLSKAKLSNTVIGKIELKEFKGKDEVTAKFDSEINVKGKVIVKYINKATGKELEKSKEITGKVGEEYTTEPIEMSKFKCVSSTDNTKGKIIEGDQEVIYYYELIKEETPTITPTITKKEEQETPVDTVKIVVPEEKIVVNTPKEKAVYTGDMYKKVYSIIVIISTIFLNSVIIIAYKKDRKMHRG